MGIWQLCNLLSLGVFFGAFCGYLAQKKGRHPFLWFFIGITLNIFGVILIYILPPKATVQRRFVPTKKLNHSDAWIKMWYYLDPKSREQKGPMEFPDLVRDWQNKMLSDSSLVWGEGMQEWKQLSQIPEVLQELETSDKK